MSVHDPVVPVANTLDRAGVFQSCETGIIPARSGPAGGNFRLKRSVYTPTASAQTGSIFVLLELTSSDDPTSSNSHDVIPDNAALMTMFQQHVHAASSQHFGGPPSSSDNMAIKLAQSPAPATIHAAALPTWRYGDSQGHALSASADSAGVHAHGE